MGVASAPRRSWWSRARSWRLRAGQGAPARVSYCQSPMGSTSAGLLLDLGDQNIAHHDLRHPARKFAGTASLCAWRVGWCVTSSGRSARRRARGGEGEGSARASRRIIARRGRRSLHKAARRQPRPKRPGHPAPLSSGFLALFLTCNGEISGACCGGGEIGSHRDVSLVGT
jgi:hypothetical protein